MTTTMMTMTTMTTMTTMMTTTTTTARMLTLPVIAGLLTAVLMLSTSCSTTGAAGLPAPGSMAPSFAAADQTGQTRTLEEFRGKPLVLFFYPSDGTPGCTAEACAFRNAWQRYADAGVAVVGVSTNDVASHAAFAAEHKLPFPLLADTDKAMLNAWGVSSTFGMAARVSFLIDGDGRIVRVFPDVDPALHAQEVLQAAAALSPTAGMAPAMTPATTPVTTPVTTPAAPPVTTSEP